ncbi:glutathione S-transferase 2-like [Strigops habroptila]|uniref:Glutathione S-transferase n=1 Tax=Strigops habroptila TaxID=2489341 RepID=A0A672UQQ5_STRHB|nr:glutathione S-transferase 2-like [Strigops habroptila]
MVMTLGYWDIRGLAHAIRLLLEYTETPYEERQYCPGPAPDFNPSDWTNEKEKLGLDFPNLPYLIDGTIKLTQSNAILRYIARKHNMCGETEEEIQRVDMLENHIMDFRMRFARLCYSPDFEKLKSGYLEELPGRLRELSQFLGSRPWFAGEKLTFVDFVAYDVLDQHRMFVPDSPELSGSLGRFLERFEALEKVSAYLHSGRCMRTPIFWRTAQWCNTKE